MPSSSKKQHNFMAAIANSPSFAKKVGVPQSVGKDFNEADKGRKFSKGGDMKESKAMVAKEMNFMKKKGAPKSMIKHEMAEAGMKKSGAAKKMMGGGMAYAKGGGIESKGKTKGKMIKMLGGGKC
jgi:hypothetical protein